MPLRALNHFLKLESAGGILLMVAAALALGVANSPLAGAYRSLLELPFVIQLGDLKLAKPLLLWINDGLMAIFFLLIGLEVKREVLEGQLSKRSQIILPTAAAVGGMVVPALCYVAINRDDPGALSGWAIPAATDIAFALGVLALLGDRVPSSLKIFLLALAILDDLGAIVIIALFYSGDLSTPALVVGGVALAALILLNRAGVGHISTYLVVGLVLWVAVLKSGVHATLAGVALAFAIPLRTDSSDDSPLRDLEHDLHPLVAYAILPIFAFANAGVSLAGMGPGSLLEPVTLGIILGLLVGKQVGVFGFAWAAIRLGWARLPDGANWRQLYGVSVLCGIGFTMSLFIGGLAFEHLGRDDYMVQNRVGILAASLAAALLGYAVLRPRVKPLVE